MPSCLLSAGDTSQRHDDVTLPCWGLQTGVEVSHLQVGPGVTIKEAQGPLGACSWLAGSGDHPPEDMMPKLRFETHERWREGSTKHG